MSCAPRSQIQHKSPYRRHKSRGIIYTFSPDVKFIASLEEVAGKPEGDEDFDRNLRDRIDAHAKTMDLPSAVLVAERGEPGDRQCRDFLSVITIQAKSSNHVYLRDKVPNLGQIKAGRRVILIIPKKGK